MKSLLVPTLIALLLLPATAGATPLPEEDLGAMAVGRARLETLSAPPVRQAFPELVARAEISFTCWTLNPEEPNPRFDGCRAAFLQDIGALERLVAQAQADEMAATH